MAIITGTSGNDVLNGTSGDDVIDGGAGDDLITDNLGNDIIRGGDGNDRIVSDRPAFVGFSARGAETVAIDAGDGADEVIFRVNGGQYGFNLFDSPTTLSVDLGSGDDVFTFAGLGTFATITTGTGRDRINIETFGFSITFTDFQTGNSGDVIDLTGLIGFYVDYDFSTNPFASGVLQIEQSGGNVELWFDQDGSDGFIPGELLVTFENTTLSSFTAANFLGFAPGGEAPVGLTLTGTAGDDTLSGGIGGDTISGLGGNDTLVGGAGNDILDGGDGNDRIEGGLGIDHLIGGAGNDTLITVNGSDIIEGGTGRDYIVHEGFTATADTIIIDAGDDDDIVEIRTLLTQGSGSHRHEIQLGSGNDRLLVSSIGTQGMSATLGLGTDTVWIDPELAGPILQGQLVITDFEAGAGGNVLDLADYLAAFPVHPDGALQLMQVGADVMVQVRRAGASGYEDFVLLQNTVAENFVTANLNYAFTIGSPPVPEFDPPALIIPDPGPAPTAPDRTEEIFVSGEFTPFTFGADEIFFATDLPTMLRAGLGNTITNNGIVWLETDRPQVFFVVADQPEIYNNGTIYLRSASQVALNNGADRVVNTGDIFTVSESGWARVVQAGRFALVENSGTMAARTLESTLESNGGNATTIWSNNGAIINNLATGQILAEAPDVAIAIEINGSDLDTGDPGVTNRGLIEAVSTGPNGISFGVIGASGTSIENYGTIRAEIAILGAGDILNAAGGMIEGLVIQESAADVIRNDGQIIGDVYTGAGDDTFSGMGEVDGFVDMGDGFDTFTATGPITGFVDMGWHDDTFEGSALADVATGSRGNDLLSGFGGNDLLLGGFGNDLIIGGTGNDGLFGEFGDDRIVTQGGDFVEGGSGADRIELGDYAFAAINGGSGFDVLVMAAGARNFSLAAMLSDQRLSAIDAIELLGNQQLAIDRAAIAKLTDDGTTFWVDATATDTVHLAGAWTRGGDVSSDGVDYQSWQQGGSTVLVTAVTAVSVNSAPAFGGLDAIVDGAAALRPGVAAGLDYTSRETFLSEYVIVDPNVESDGSYEFVVTGEEIFFTVGEGFVFRAGETLSAFTNNGVISAFNDETHFANGITLSRQQGFIDFTNNGLVSVEATGPVGGIHSESIVSVGVAVEGDLTNRGEISVFSASGNVLGAWVTTRAGLFENAGDVIAISGARSAEGVNADGLDVFGQQAFFNTGLIYAEGANVSDPSILDPITSHPVAGAVAVAFRGGGDLTNDGLIIAAVGANAVEGARSVGVATFPRSGGSTTVTNNGQISGTISVFFYGTDGNVLDNNGLLIGDVWFAQGNDTYDNAGGETRGVIFGFDGDDSFTGGAFADRFNGGLGNDTLDGGSNVDTAIVSGLRSAYTVTQTATGVFRVVGADGTDVLTAIEFLQFDDQILRLLPGSGVSVNFETANPAVYQAAMNAIRDFDGNVLGGNGSWLRIGSADVNGDGDIDQILVNDAIGRFATVGTAPDGLVYFSDHGWAGETRVAGIYIDPQVAAGIVEAGSPNDSQQRFQNDLSIENINRVLGANDYDNDGLQEVFFALTDGTAFLRALMEADGNIRYANYQSQQEVIDYLTANGFGTETWAGWFTSSSAGTASFAAQDSASNTAVPAFMAENSALPGGLALTPDSLHPVLGAFIGQQPFQPDALSAEFYG